MQCRAERVSSQQDTSNMLGVCDSSCSWSAMVKVEARGRAGAWATCIFIGTHVKGGLHYSLAIHV
jgi:hypothetical protein